MRGWLTLILALWATAPVAQDYPALFTVVGVAADDVLNIRERPSAAAAVIGALPPGTPGVEVLAIRNGWALIATGEGAGHVAARFLQAEGGPVWSALQTPLLCSGTEPFWSLLLDPAAGTARFQTPEDPAPQGWQIDTTWPGQPWAQAAALDLANGLAVLSPATCSDGMSDRPYGIAVDLFLTDPAGARLSGCCTLVAN